jgi:competence protein ComEA
MDISQIQEKILPLLKNHLWPVVLGFLGLSFLGYGLIQSTAPQRDSSEITFESGQQSDPSTSPAKIVTSKAKEITVDVEGAVLKPGIHKLAADSRVQDALIEAGGMSEKADRTKVSKGMNLAAKLMDGGKIYIPFEGEAASASFGQVAGASDGTSGELSGVVNINTASESQLDTLSGVGPATAQKIITNRPYSSIDELVSKKAVGKSVFEKIKEKVSI